MGIPARSLGVCRVGIFAFARGRNGVVAALILLGMVACRDAVLVRQDGGGGLDDLPRRVTAPPAQPAGPARLAGAPALALRSDDGFSATVAQGIAPPPPPPLVIPTSPSEWFNPRGQHEGTEGIVTDLAQLGVTDNAPLYVNECWGRTWGAATSDHHQSQLRSWACDLSIAGIQTPTPQADEAAQRIGSALGEPGWKGGSLNKTIDGYRIQVLWRVAGHFNHVHIGVRKI